MDHVYRATRAIILRLFILLGLFSVNCLVAQIDNENPPPASEILKQEIELARKIRAWILENRDSNTDREFERYTAKIPDSEARFDMIPIPAGEFVMGSPESEHKRKRDEGPQRTVRIDAFWMGRTEVTWNEYELYIYPKDEHYYRGKGIEKPTGEPKRLARRRLVDAISYPSGSYVEMSFGMGKDGFPAIAMTQFGARRYCQWLSAQTGQFFRLPTEAEWEYACRAGSTTAYHFGDDPAKLGDYAWFHDNSDWKYQKVGTKKPNSWGLHDMHGNVAEWGLDFHESGYPNPLPDGILHNPLNRPIAVFPRVVRGGSWDDAPEKIRSAARLGSHPGWKIQDPFKPKSVWWHTDAQIVGMRVVRPRKLPSAEAMAR